MRPSIGSNLFKQIVEFHWLEQRENPIERRFRRRERLQGHNFRKSKRYEICEENFGSLIINFEILHKCNYLLLCTNIEFQE